MIFRILILMVVQPDMRRTAEGWIALGEMLELSWELEKEAPRLPEHIREGFTVLAEQNDVRGCLKYLIDNMTENEFLDYIKEDTH